VESLTVCSCFLNPSLPVLRDSKLNKIFVGIVNILEFQPFHIFNLSLNKFFFLCFGQKYRLHTRRPSPPSVHNTSSPQAAPFVLVGNIFVQSPEYAAVATSTASREVTTVAAPAGVYAPVATHPTLVSQPSADSMKKPQFQKFKHSEHSNSDERAHHSEGAVHSNSPASSSSTHTSASPSY